MSGEQKAQGCRWVEGVVLGKSGEVAGAIAQECAEQGRTQESEVASAAHLGAAFLVFAPGDVAAVMVGAFDFPVAASAREPLPRSQSGALEGRNEEAQIAAAEAGFLVEGLAFDRQDGGGVGEAELLRGDAGQGQGAMFGAAVGAVVGEKRGAWCCTAWAA